MHHFRPQRLCGFVLLAMGLLLLAFARYGALDPMNELTSSLTGRDTGQALWLVGAGAVAALAGVLLMLAARLDSPAAPPARRTMPP